LLACIATSFCASFRDQSIAKANVRIDVPKALPQTPFDGTARLDNERTILNTDFARLH
jgi:hypothetical protein